MRALAVLLLVLASQASAETIAVPGDVPLLADAIDLAAPGDTILMAAGFYAGTEVVLDKPLRLVGAGVDQTILVSTTCPGGGCAGATAPTIRLEGSGGTMSLENLTILGGVSFFPARKYAAISGGGFDSVRVLDAEVRELGWPEFDAAPTGYAIFITCPLWLIASEVVGDAQPGGIPWCALPLPEDYEAKPAIVAPWVVLLESSVSVGVNSWATTCGPDDCRRDWNPGAPGIIAAEVFASSSSIQGGEGGVVSIYDGAVLELVCPQSDGPPVRGTLIDVEPIDASWSWELPTARVATARR